MNPNNFAHQNGGRQQSKLARIVVDKNVTKISVTNIQPEPLFH